jgi:hypothetical protein
MYSEEGGQVNHFPREVHPVTLWLAAADSLTYWNERVGWIAWR